MIVRRFAAAVVVAAIGATACEQAPPLSPYDPVVHAADVEEWRAWRHGELTKPDGWLSLSGLYWLTPGEHRFGADPEADLVYARAGVPPHLGTFTVTGGQVEFAPEPGLEIGVGETVPAVDVVFDRALLADGPMAPTIMRWGDLQWFVIVREDHLALRLKDAASALIVGFDGMPNFDLTSEWRFEATFEVYDPPRTITVPNVFGSLGEEESPGAVVFELNGETFRIDMWHDSDDPENFFTAFGDLTNAHTSYGAGRFLWVDAPDEWGRTVVDFNRSYNPPCALSPFATCPLPPIRNRLLLAIEAGERVFSTSVELPSAPPVDADGV